MTSEDAHPDRTTTDDATDATDATEATETTETTEATEASAAPASGRPVDPTKTQKKQLRTAAWDRRRAEKPRGDERRRLDEAVAEHGTTLLAELLDGPSRICTYESWPVEPPTTSLNAALLEAGHELLVPITMPDLDLDWRPIGSPDEPESGLGIETLATIDLVLAPGTLVDRSGNRLGQGGGCYDRTLPRLRPGTPVVVVLFDGELVDEPLPRAPHDMLVDIVLQPGGVTRLR